MRILQMLGAILLLFASPAIAKDGGRLAWIVTQKSGQVQVIRNGVQPASVQVRASLSPGDIIATGADGRAMLTRGDDYVVVAPGSRLLLPKEEQPTGFTRLMQQVGTMFYKVRHTGVPHFAVETPMLAAVVKGTSFTVIVETDRSAVQVTEGVVEVSAATGESRRLVERGMTVYVGRERPSEIIELKSASELPPAGGDTAVKIEGSGDVPLSAVADLTGGLVREEPVTIVAAATTPVVNPVSPVSTSGPSATSAEQAGTPAEPVTEQATPAAGTATEAVDNVTEPAVEAAETVAEPAGDVVETVTEPVVDVVEAVAEPIGDVTEPVVDVVETVTEPVVEVVETVTEPVADVTEPVVEVVETVTEPVVDVVETVTEPVAEVTEPVVEVVETVTEPVVEVTEPVVEVVETVTEPVVEVTEPVVEVVETVTQPIVEVPDPVTDTLGSLLPGP